MDLMDFRRRAMAYNTVMLGNKMDFDAIGVVAPDIYAVVAAPNNVEIKKISSDSNYYGRAVVNLSDFALVSGKKYRLTAKIKGFSRSNLTGFIYIADNNSSIKAQTEQINTLSIGDKLSMEFTYNPDTMKLLSFYMNRDFNVPIDTYIIYGDVLLLATK